MSPRPKTMSSRTSTDGACDGSMAAFLIGASFKEKQFNLGVVSWCCGRVRSPNGSIQRKQYPQHNTKKNQQWFPQHQKTPNYWDERRIHMMDLVHNGQRRRLCVQRDG